jgi:hypothetical protein
MNYQDFVGKSAFVQSSHGLHYGKVLEIDYDNISMENAVFFIVDFGDETYRSCVEYMSSKHVEEYRIVFSTKRAGKLIITNAREISVVDDDLQEYYDDLFETQHGDK